MNDLTIFNYGETPIRTIQNESGVWWVLADVCAVLEIANSRDAASRLDDDEKDGVGITDTMGRQQTATVVNEPGLYNLIFRSNKPEAKNFKRWVTHEVLPTIRKTGSYGEKREIANLIASCKSAAAVKGILALYGVSTNDHHITHTITENSVTGYLSTVETWELTDVSTKRVHKDYVLYCKERRIVPLGLTGFSKEIHKQTGMTVKRYRVEGELVGFYR